MIFDIIIAKIHWYFKRKRWKQLNPRNKTFLLNDVNLALIKVGDFSYGGLEVYSWGTRGEMLQIGRFVSIASGVKFLLGGNKHTDHFLMNPTRNLFFDKSVRPFGYSKGPIIVEDDVWLCTDVTVLSGVTIGKGAICMAGSMITKDVPPFAIVSGIPAKVVRYRFSPELQKEMLNIDFLSLNEDALKHLDTLLHTSLTPEILSQIKDYLGRTPAS